MIALLIFFTVMLIGGFAVFFGAPFVPSRPSDVRVAFTKLYRLTNSDLLVDLGSGEGVVLRGAARCGATAIGYEINPLLVIWSKIASRKYANISVRLANYYKIDFPDETTIVYTFGDSRDLNKMVRKVEAEATRMGKPLWFISYGFRVSDKEIQNQVGASFLYLIEPLQKELT